MAWTDIFLSKKNRMERAVIAKAREANSTRKVENAMYEVLGDRTELLSVRLPTGSSSSERKAADPLFYGHILATVDNVGPQELLKVKQAGLVIADVRDKLRDRPGEILVRKVAHAESEPQLQAALDKVKAGAQVGFVIDQTALRLGGPQERQERAAAAAVAGRKAAAGPIKPVVLR